jgi:glycosyltransferase involved in cell wall biosynthesis
LRGLSSVYDIIALHTHPFDVVPLIAFSPNASRVPVVTVNHADHVFWLGTTVSTAVINLRESGRRLCVQRRGVSEERALLLPLPLGRPQRLLDRAEAKGRVGLSPDTILILTVGQSYKYKAVDRPGFLDLIIPVLERHPSAILIAVGPESSAEWAQAAERTSGRVRALGPQSDATDLYDAADIYVDSYPFASPTALLEVAARGTASVSYVGHPAAAAVLCVDTPGVDGRLLRANDPDQYREVFKDLINDPEYRSSVGEGLRESVLAAHCGEEWTAACEEVYEVAGALPLVPNVGEGVLETGPLDLRVSLLHQGTSVAALLRSNLSLLPAADRIAGWRRLRREGMSVAAKDFLPELRPTMLRPLFNR